MYWPDTQTGVDVEPARKPVASAVRKYFTEGGAGTPPTVPGGDWFNQFTNEMLNVLAAAGIDPSKTDDDQLLKAINSISKAMSAREALRRTYAEAGFNLVPGSFELGGTVTTASEVLLYEADGHAYSWDGTFPVGGKDVPQGSTPSTTGGVGPGLWLDKLSDTLRQQLSIISVRFFGATGDGITDDTSAIETACLALKTLFSIDGVRRTLWFPDGTYRTSRTIYAHSNMAVECAQRVVFQNKKAVKDFVCIEIQGGAKRSVLNVIDGYLAGFRIINSTHHVLFQTISNCIDGVVIRADVNNPSKSSLDNVVRGVQIGKCTNGIVFEQNADDLVQQGNEVRVNFVSETQNTLVFRNFDGFVHTRQSDWDSNFIELIASDPLTAADASMVRNYTSFSVPNITFSVLSWCGGWTYNAETMCLIRGSFSTGAFLFNLAQKIGLNELVDAPGTNSLGSCSIKLSRTENLGSASSFYQAVTPGASFNGGSALMTGKFRIRATVPDLAPGQTFGLSFWHVLVPVSGIGRVVIDQYSDFARGKYLIELRDAGTELKGMVRLWITNIKSTTVTGGDVDLVISVR